MPQPHLLFLASWYPNRNAPALGNFIREHARAAALKYTVSVVYAVSEEQLADGATELTERNEGRLNEYIVYFGKTQTSLPVISQVKKRNAYRNAMLRGIAAAEKAHGKGDLLHVHVIWPAAIVALPFLQERSLPLLISEHWSGYLPEDGNYRGPLMTYFTRQLAAKARQITVVSRRMEAAMRKHGLGHDFSILPNTVDTTLFAPATHAHHPSKLKLLHVSMLVDREKNISGLLRVMKKLEQHPDISLEIVGDGPERGLHEDHARRLGLLDRNVFFSGFKNAGAVAEAMRQSDALLMFSHFEGMPVTIIEAQCCGLPVISSEVGAVPEMVDSSNGLLVKPGDEAALEKAILELREKKSSFNPAAIREKAVATYSRESVSRELDRLYQSVLHHG